MADATEFIEGGWPIFIAWVVFLFVSAITALNVLRHLSCYSRPDLQPHVLRIIVVGPLYALSAALCLSIGEFGCFFVSSVRDVWEAVVIYSFLTLIIEYMGGEHMCLHSISQRSGSIPHLFPLNLILEPLPLASMIRVPKIGALQFVIIKPLVVVMSIVAFAVGEFQDWYYQWTLCIVYNISYSVALYALYLIYWASHDHPSFQSKSPLMKFISVKMVVFLTFWQALFLPHVPLPGSVSRWEDLIIAIEMVFFAILMNIAFSWKEFHSGLQSKDLRQKRSKRDHDKKIQLDTDIIEVENAGCGKSGATGKVHIGRSGVSQNAAAAFCPRDIIFDASTNFSRKYQQHVLIESAQEYELHTSDSPVCVAENDVQNFESNAAAGKTDSFDANSARIFRAKTYLVGQSMSVGSATLPAAASISGVTAQGLFACSHPHERPAEGGVCGHAGTPGVETTPVGLGTTACPALSPNAVEVFTAGGTATGGRPAQNTLADRTGLNPDPDVRKNAGFAEREIGYSLPLEDGWAMSSSKFAKIPDSPFA